MAGNKWVTEAITPIKWSYGPLLSTWGPTWNDAHLGHDLLFFMFTLFTFLCL